MLVLLAALVSPLDSLADQLFFMHMVQHMLLLDIVPILAIVGADEGDPAPAHALGLDARAPRRAARAPRLRGVLYVGVIWAWHIPGGLRPRRRGTQASTCSSTLSFLLAGSLYWWHLLSPIRARMRLGGLGPVVYMASTKLFVGALGMGLAFAPRTLYPFYAHHAARVGHLSRRRPGDRRA